MPGRYQEVLEKKKHLPSIISQCMMPATAPSLNEVKFIAIYSIFNNFLKYKFHDFKYLPLGRNKLTSSFPSFYSPPLSEQLQWLTKTLKDHILHGCKHHIKGWCKQQILIRVWKEHFCISKIKTQVV